MGKETTNRNHFLDLLKGLCIILVIITHCSWNDDERVKLLFPFWVDMAVTIFMIVSGYVGTLSLNRKNLSLLNMYSPKEVLKKLLRYTVPYIYIYNSINYCF